MEEEQQPKNQRKPPKKAHQNQNQRPPKEEKSSAPTQAASWAAVRSLFTCKHVERAKTTEEPNKGSSKKCKKTGCSGSLCNNTRVMQRPETSSSSSPEESKKWGLIISSCNASNASNGSSSSRSMKAPLNEINGVVPVSSSSNSSISSSSSSSKSFKGMQLRRLSGCYECRMVVDPSRGGAGRETAVRATLVACPDCEEVFMKPEILELHQSVRHAVSELGPEDTSKNIVEIIFQSSWLKKQIPICQIERILKVQNSQKTIARFEDYRDSIKAKANKHAKKHPRCIADGNELLRFHCTTFVCSIGMNGSTNLCNLIPQCNVCSIIRNGFKCDSVNKRGICTTATSGKAHDNAEIVSENEKRAMLVCRVIAGRVKMINQDANGEEFDSVAGTSGIYSDLDELFVFNPKAILPCFVVIYKNF
ncbi:hypothetical protein Scep_002834 [Stephania cephalantha]|uniref:C2H2-type domain-containing protein n=1 Tax=Stephania cephalantha TaxID=152367 RepID=A0AAP0LBY1_9MAGN